MRTYSYGAEPPIKNAALVQREIERGHRYRNTLAEFGRAYYAIKKSVWDSRNARFQAEIDRLKAAGSSERPAGPPSTSEETAQIKAAVDARNAAVRDARQHCGITWGTYQFLEEAAGRALASKEVPRFHRWEGEGTFAVHLQGGPFTVTDLLAADDSRVRLEGGGEGRKLSMRVESDGRAPVWAVFPIAYHRDLPPTARIRWVRISVRRVATKFVYAAQFVLDDMPEKSGLGELPPATKGTIAVDVGWRNFGAGGIRVAVWVDDMGQKGELRIPARLVDRWEKVASLGSIRDRAFNTAIADFRACRNESWPEWLLNETRFIAQWTPKSTARLALLMWRWKMGDLPGPIEVRDRMEAWRKQDKHLYEWEANQREDVLRARREIYRIFARFLAQYRCVVVEQLDLRDFAKLPEKGETEDPRATAARGRRFFVALSELLGCAQDAVGRAWGQYVPADPKMTTQTCAVCETEERFDAAGSITHTCSHCGEAWDQDENAAKNLLRAARCLPPAPTRSQMEEAVTARKATSLLRRQKGLEARIAKRSQKAVEVPGKKKVS